jgi:hypothetical protein
VGLAARFLEEAHFSTLVLTPTHEFHNAIGIPRSAALSLLEEAQKPGEVRHLPYTWPEDPKDTKWQPPEMSPMIKLYLDEIKQAR